MQPTAPRSLRIAGATAALCLGACGGSGPEVDGQRATPNVREARNVLLFVVDTLRADRLGAYGYARETSPNLDALAAGGTLFQNHRSQGCWTIPSMVSMMSGAYLTRNETALSPELDTLAERVSDGEIPTAAFIGNMVLARHRGFERGFDDRQMDRRGESSAQYLYELFEEWMEVAEPDIDEGGFFAWVHAMDPHHPYKPRRSNDIFEGGGPDEARLRELWNRERETVEQLAPEGLGLTHEEAIQKMIRTSNRYDAEVLGMDESFGLYLELLEAKGMRDETLVVFASDHGEMLFEYPHYPLELGLKLDTGDGLPDGLMDYFVLGHRAWYYAELWNTPLILNGPGVPAGRVSEALSANIDIYPTVLDAFGLKLPTDRPGVSLLNGHDPEREQVFAFGFETTAVLDRDGFQLLEHDPLRFVSEGALDLDPPPTDRRLELFDTRGARTGWTDQAEAHPAERDRLLAEMKAWRETWHRDVIGVPSQGADEALRQLGYLGDGPGGGIVPDSEPEPSSPQK